MVRVRILPERGLRLTVPLPDEREFASIREVVRSSRRRDPAALRYRGPYYVFREN